MVVFYIIIFVASNICKLNEINQRVWKRSVDLLISIEGTRCELTEYMHFKRFKYCTYFVYNAIILNVNILQYNLHYLKSLER